MKKKPKWSEMKRTGANLGPNVLRSFFAHGLA